MLIYLIVFVLHVVSMRGQEPCTTPDNKPGVCESIFKCPRLRAMAMQVDTAPEHLRQGIVDQLLQSKCYDDDSWTVCCNDCVTPDNQNGTIKSLRECPHLLNWLTERTNLDYVSASRIDTTSLNVCCGAPMRLSQPPDDECNKKINFPPDPGSRCCGVDMHAGSRISGGKITGIEEYPWTVLLEYERRGVLSLMDCGGSLVSNRVVVTAAHCIRRSDGGPPKNVRVGEFDTTYPGKDCQDLPESEGQECNDGAISVPIEAYLVHHEHNIKPNYNDIALIRLKESVAYTDFVRPICLPSIDYSSKGLYSFTVAGWGRVNQNISRSRYKRSVRVNLVNRQVCQNAYKFYYWKGYYPLLWEQQLCAGGEQGKDSCDGDSGGPLMAEDESGDHFELAGVVSFGVEDCGEDGMPGVYTSVYHYVDWIRDNARERSSNWTMA